MLCLLVCKRVSVGGLPATQLARWKCVSINQAYLLPQLGLGVLGGHSRAVLGCWKEVGISWSWYGCLLILPTVGVTGSCEAAQRADQGGPHEM